MVAIRPYRLCPIAGSAHQFVLGMTWQTVLGQNLTQAASQTARELGATHYTQAGSRSPAVGVIKATGRDNRSKAKARLYSAAAAFAQLHRHGTHIACVDLGSDDTWIVVSVDGVVQTGGDLVVRGAGPYRQKLNELRERYVDGVIHTSSESDADAQALTLHQLSKLANAQSALRRASFHVSMIAPIWWGLAALCLTAFTIPTLLQWHDARQQRAREQLRALESAVDPETSWQQNIATWAASIHANGSAGLQRLLAAVGDVPINPGRWIMQEIDCRPSACTALYKRGRLANNQTLQDALPAAWHVQFSDLDTARVQWQLAAPPLAALDLNTLASASTMEYGYLPTWQALRPALQDFTLSPATPVAIAAPRITLPNGLDQPIVLPATVRVPAARTLVINAPLRSLSALVLPPASIVEQLQVRYLPDAMPAIAHSRLVATLRGLIYVRS